MKKVIFSCLTLAVAGLFFARPVGAAKSLTYGGLSITPAIEQLVIQPNQSSISFQIRLDNNLKTPVSIQASSLDFKSLNASGGLAFIGSGGSTVDHKYGLANWIDLPADNIVLAPNQGQFVNVQIENRTDLSPGGHYAAILFQVNAASQSGTNQVSANQVVSSLVFVRKVGGEHFGLNLKKPSLPVSWLRLPNNVDLSFTNTGNTQTAPRGTVIFKNMFGTQVGNGIVNPNSSLVLPGSNRVIRTPINVQGRIFWPGLYSVNTAYQPDDGSAAKITSTKFLYINLPLILVVVVLIFAIDYLQRYLRWRWRKWRHPKKP